MSGLRGGYLTGRRVNGIDPPVADGASLSGRPLVGMLPSLPKPRTLIPYAETLLIAAVCGVAFTLLGVPAGLISGSMLVTAVAALLGRPMNVPLPLAWVCFVLIGILLGAVVTPATLRGMATTAAAQDWFLYSGPPSRLSPRCAPEWSASDSRSIQT